MKHTKNLILAFFLLLALFSCEENAGNETLKKTTNPSLAMEGEGEPDAPIDPDEEPMDYPTIIDVTPQSDPNIDNSAVEIIEKRTPKTKTFLLPNGNHLLVLISMQKSESYNKAYVNGNEYTYWKDENWSSNWWHGVQGVGYDDFFDMYKRLLVELPFSDILSSSQRIKNAYFDYGVFNHTTDIKIKVYTPSFTDNSSILYTNIESNYLTSMSFDIWNRYHQVNFTDRIKSSYESNANNFYIALINDNETSADHFDDLPTIFYYIEIENITTPPNTPSLTSPSTGHITTSNSLTLQWTASQGLPTPTHTLEVVKPDNTVLTFNNLSGTSKYLSNLSPGQYKWRVKGVNSVGSSDFTNYNIFTVNPNVNNYSVNLTDLTQQTLGPMQIHWRAQLESFPSAFNYSTKWYKQEDTETFSYSNATLVGTESEHSAVQGDAYHQGGIYGSMGYYVVFEAFGIKTDPQLIYSISYLKSEGAPDVILD